MNKLAVAALLSLFCFAVPCSARGEDLQSGEYFIKQSWSQETDYRRSYHVQVPTDAKRRGKLPVFVFLHGNGGNGEGAMQGFLRRNRQLAQQYITVFPDGYQKSWNIVSERSKADDRGFIESIVQNLSGYDNVQSETFTIMGSSNGAALVNQLAIECRLTGIRNYITAVSPLNVFQHDGNHFRAKGAENDYRRIATPLAGKRLLNISGTDDRLVPYRGGLSRAIPAKGGKLGFIDAEQSTFLWAQAMGYRGPKQARPTKVAGNLETYIYPGGDIVHIKVIGEGHGASRAVGEKLLLDFLQDNTPN